MHLKQTRTRTIILSCAHHDDIGEKPKTICIVNKRRDDRVTLFIKVYTSHVSYNHDEKLEKKKKNVVKLSVQ